MSIFLMFKQFKVKSYFPDTEILFELPFEDSAFSADKESVIDISVLNQKIPFKKKL